MCPDWESNQQLFDPPASTQSIEPHQPVHATGILIGIALTLYITLCSKDILTVLILQVNKQGISFHYLYVIQFLFSMSYSFQ